MSSAIVKESLKNNAAIRDTVLEYNLIGEEDLNKILSPEEMTQPREADQELINKIKESSNYKKFLENL